MEDLSPTLQACSLDMGTAWQNPSAPPAWISLTSYWHGSAFHSWLLSAIAEDLPPATRSRRKCMTELQDSHWMTSLSRLDEMEKMDRFKNG